MKVFITGATGLLGNNVIRELLLRKIEIKALVRDRSKISITNKYIEYVEGDIVTGQQLAEGMQGCDAVIHIAATTEQNMLHYPEYYNINAKGSLNVLKAAQVNHIKRFIYISSANTIGSGTKDNPADESYSPSLPFSGLFYAKSKIDAQKLLLENARDTEIIILNPTFMIGAYDMKPSSGKLILMGLRKLIVFIPKGGKNFIHVQDAAKAVCNAITEGKPNQQYLLGNENLSFHDFFKKQQRVCGYKQILITVPNFILLFAGLFGDFLRILGIKTSLCSRNIKVLLVQEYYTAQKAIHELHLSQTPIAEAIKDAVNWFEQKKD